MINENILMIIGLLTLIGFWGGFDYIHTKYLEYSWTKATGRPKEELHQETNKELLKWKWEDEKD